MGLLGVLGAAKIAFCQDGVSDILLLSWAQMKFPTSMLNGLHGHRVSEQHRVVVVVVVVVFIPRQAPQKV
jgi:hypothetical protein